MCLAITTNAHCESRFLDIPHDQTQPSQPTWKKSPKCEKEFKHILSIKPCKESVSGGKCFLSKMHAANEKTLENGAIVADGVKIEWCNECRRWNEERERKVLEKKERDGKEFWWMG
jgi:hypothetical protein